MDEQRVAERLASAERRLVRLQQRLHRAVMRSKQDDTELEQLALQYYEARREAEAALEAWRRLQSTPRTAEAQPQVAPDPPPALAPTARLRFARWLYEQGYISG
jgi:predicted  nucleic acid-binding Zn-ribbon protein